MFTGEGDLMELRNYESVSDFSTIEVVMPMFDGENVYTGHYNPYKEVVLVEGNDGNTMAPG